MKEKLIYKEHYKKWTHKIKKEYLPKLKHITDCECTEAYLLSAGKINRDGKEIEYQELRIYLEFKDEHN